MKTTNYCKPCTNCFWEDNCPDSGRRCRDYYNPANNAIAEAEYETDLHIRYKASEADYFSSLDIPIHPTEV